MDLDLDNYKLSELLNIYQLSSLPNSEIVIDDIYNNRINNSNISSEIKNFLFNIKIRLKMEVREKLIEKKGEKKKDKHESIASRLSGQNKRNKDPNIHSTYLCLDSRFRNNYYKTDSNNFIIDLPYEFNNVIKLGLMSIEIVNSITTLSVESENNKFDISYNSGDGDISGNNLYNVVIEDGNYSSSDFAIEINKDLNDSFGLGHIELIFNKNTGKTIIQSKDPNGHFNIYFGENKQEPFNTLGYKMGFRKKEYKHKYKLESESLFDLTGEKYFFLYVDDYNCNYYRDTIVSVQSNDYLTKNILGRITMGGDKYQVVYEDTSDLIKKERIYSGPINLKKLHIKLLNVYGNIANINKIDYSIIFEIVQKITS
jgi:hypothetical protein